jgi:hypothetical protein
LTGLIIGVLLLIIYTLLELYSGRPQALLAGTPPVQVGCEYLLGDYRIGVVGIILLAYSMSARYKLTAWTHRAMEALGGPEPLDAEALAESRAWGFLPGFLGFIICVTFAFDIAERDIEWTSDYWILPHIFNWGWTLPFGWVGGRLIYSVITNAIIVSRLARSIVINDLDEKAPINSTVRHGLNSALISITFLGIISVHFIDPGLDLPAVLFLVVLFLLGSGISALPSLGVMRSYYERRDKQLDLLRSEIAIEQQQLLDKDADYEPGRISDLAAMEQRLAGWHVTLFHFSTVARLGLYAAIGFFSWLTAAAVSAFVENLFGF